MYLEIRNHYDKVEAYAILKKLRVPYIICAESLFRKRTIDQNKYYHKCILKHLSDAIGELKSDVEEELLIECACVKSYKDEEGNIVYEVERTSDMTTMRFEAFCEDCKRYAMIRYNVYLLSPREAISDYLDLHGKIKKIIK